MLWRQLREHQIRKMTHFGYENKNFLDSAVSFYAHMLYNLGVLAARIQANGILIIFIFNSNFNILIPGIFL
jgi:hypothetical protein